MTKFIRNHHKIIAAVFFIGFLFTLNLKYILAQSVDTQPPVIKLDTGSLTVDSDKKIIIFVNLSERITTINKDVFTITGGAIQNITRIDPLDFKLIIASVPEEKQVTIVVDQNKITDLSGNLNVNPSNKLVIDINPKNVVQGTELSKLLNQILLNQRNAQYSMQNVYYYNNNSNAPNSNYNYNSNNQVFYYSCFGQMIPTTQVCTRPNSIVNSGYLNNSYYPYPSQYPTNTYTSEAIFKEIQKGDESKKGFNVDQNYCGNEQDDFNKLLDKGFKQSDSEKANKNNPNFYRFIYTISGGQNAVQTLGAKDPVVEREINTIVQMVPKLVLSKYLDNIKIYDDPKSDTIASMWFSPENASKFTFSINRSKYFSQSKEEKTFTVVHEIIHLVGDRPDQYVEGGGNCSGYYESKVNRCYLAQKIYTKFSNTYWAQKNPSSNNYVSEYAKTDSGEDFAESGAYYVLDTDLTKEKNDQAISKIDFFHLNKDAGDIDMEDFKKEFRDLIGRSETCK